MEYPFKVLFKQFFLCSFCLLFTMSDLFILILFPGYETPLWCMRAIIIHIRLYRSVKFPYSFLRPTHFWVENFVFHTLSLISSTVFFFFFNVKTGVSLIFFYTIFLFFISRTQDVWLHLFPSRKVWWKSPDTVIFTDW